MARSRIQFGTCFWAVCLLAFPTTAATQEHDKTVALRIPDGWLKLPTWMEPGLPFDASAYYGIDERQNRERPYLKGFLEINFSDVYPVIPDVTSTADFEARKDTDRRRKHAFRELWGQHVEYRDDAGKRISIDPKGIVAFERILKEYAPGIELIRNAQQRARCFFHIHVDTVAINPHQMMAREIAELLGIHCNLNPGHDRAVDDVRMILQLKRDLQKLGETVTQMGLYASEGICFNWMVQTILENPTTQSDQLDQLIDILSEHQQVIQETDPVIEAARYEYLMLHNLFRQLETDEYDAERRSKELELNQTLSIPSMVIFELTSLKNYGINEFELKSEVALLAQKGPEAAELPEQYDELRKKKSRDNETAFEKYKRQRAEIEVDSLVLLPLLLNQLISMTPKDYENEISILRARCRQITEACQLNFPESTNQLRILGNHWTSNNECKDSKILRWFKPDHDLSLLRIRSTLQANAFLCLTATKKWQLENPGEAPTCLDRIMLAAGIHSVPIDPFSGKPLKLAVIEDDIVIYSVGPDGDDDHAREEYDIDDPSRGEDNKGDVVFRIPRR